jgi:hypothetical protein
VRKKCGKKGREDKISCRTTKLCKKMGWAVGRRGGSGVALNYLVFELVQARFSSCRKGQWSPEQLDSGSVTRTESQVSQRQAVK